MVSGKKKVEELGAPPTAEELAGRLGRAMAAWDRVVADVGRGCGPVVREWRRFSAKFPWTYTVQAGERKLVYLVPGEGSFAASVVLGEKAVALALEGELADEVRAAIEGAKKYAEGRPVKLEVRRVSEVPAVVRLVACKLAATGAPRKAGATPARGRARGGARL